MDAREIVKEVVETSGLSKARLCRAAGMSRSSLDAYLSGESSPTVRQLQRLADAAGCEIVTTVRKQSSARPVPDTLVAVLEFGELFPVKEFGPLPDMTQVWANARNAG